MGALLLLPLQPEIVSKAFMARPYMADGATCELRESQVLCRQQHFLVNSVLICRFLRLCTCSRVLLCPGDTCTCSCASMPIACLHRRIMQLGDITQSVTVQIAQRPQHTQHKHLSRRTQIAK